MVDVFLFLSSLKIGWLRRVVFGESGLRDTMFELYADLYKLRMLGAEFANEERSF